MKEGIAVPLWCCNKKMQIIKTLELSDTVAKKQRVLVIARCKNSACSCLKGEFIYLDWNTGELVYEKVPKADLHKVIELYSKYPFLSDLYLHVKNGTKQNQHWIYGETRRNKDVTEHYACNFNGEKRKIQ